MKTTRNCHRFTCL